jgi:hypothetical protein
MKLGLWIGSGLIIGNHMDQSLWLANLTMVLISRKQPKNLNVKEEPTFYTKTWHCHHFTCKGLHTPHSRTLRLFGDTLKQWIELCSLSSYINHVSRSPPPIPFNIFMSLHNVFEWMVQFTCPPKLLCPNRPEIFQLVKKTLLACSRV